MSLEVRLQQLELAVLALARSQFGDIEGHDFHGNQWTGGKGGDPTDKNLNGRSAVPRVKPLTENARYKITAGVGRWTGGQDPTVHSAMQAEAETLLLGKPIKGDRSSYFAGTTKALLQEIDHSGASSPPLYRGMVVPAAVAEEFRNTKSFDVGLASFSESKAVAGHFASSTRNYDQLDGVQVLMSVSKAQALDVSETSEFKREREWISSGRFEVSKIEDGMLEGKPLMKITLKQTGTFAI